MGCVERNKTGMMPTGKRKLGRKRWKQPKKMISGIMTDLEGKQRHGTLPRTEGILENLNRQKAVGNVMLPTACNVVCFFCV